MFFNLFLLTADTAHADQESEQPVLAQTLQEEAGSGEEGLPAPSSQQEEEVSGGSEDPAEESGGRRRGQVDRRRDRSRVSVFFSIL